MKLNKQVQPVTLVVVSGDCLWVVVDHDGGLSETSQFTDTANCTRIKLYRTTNSGNKKSRGGEGRGGEGRGGAW